MDVELSKKLFEKYKDLFLVDPTLKKSLMAFGFECGNGWYHLLDELFSKIQQVVKEKGGDKNSVQIVQVKEKWGGLTVYARSQFNEVFKLINEYKQKSYEVCELCGAKGELRTVIDWDKTLCDKCYEEY